MKQNEHAMFKQTSQEKKSLFFCRTNELFRSNCKLLLAAIFLKLGFIPWKAEQLLKDMEFQEKKVQKD